MGTIIANTMMTLNGVAGRPEEWQFDYVSPPMMGVIADSLQSSVGLLLGRRTYEEFEQYWPSVREEDNPMAPAMNELPKYVVSATLSEVTWANSTLVPGDDAVAELTELRARADGHISIIGSPSLVRSLLEVGLVDRLALMVYPLVVVDGVKLFEGATSRTGLTLQECAELPNGVLQLTYGQDDPTSVTEPEADR